VVPSPYKGSLFGAVVADDGAIVAFGMRGRIYRSSDAGKSWKQVDNTSQATLMGGTRLPDGGIVLAGAAEPRSSRATTASRSSRSPPAPRARFPAPCWALRTAVLLLGEAGALAVTLPSAPKR
jgi:photosystem II stability/assembly factor-like uncharacterized protein